MDRLELINLLKLIIKTPKGTSERQHSKWIMQYRENVPHPSGDRVDVDIKITIEDIENESEKYQKYVEAKVEKALSYKPIILPEKL